MKRDNAITGLNDEAIMNSNKAKPMKIQTSAGEARQMADLLRKSQITLTLKSGRKITAKLTPKDAGACLVFWCNGDRLFEAKFQPAAGLSREATPWACKAFKPFLALDPAEYDEFKDVARVLASACMDHWASMMTRRN